MAAMQRIALALLIVSLAACGEEPPPPKPKKAPEPPKVEKKAPPAPPKEEPKPPPTPPPAEPAKPKPAAAPVAKALLDPKLPEWSEQAPAVFKAKFTTTKGDFTIEVHREWAPRGADRFYTLVKNGYYDGVRFFRVVAGFMAQFGIHGSPEVNAVWKDAAIQDDPVTQSNTRGMVTYAMRGPNTRTVQIFINYDDKNTRLDGMNFAPFGKVVEGMDVVDKLHSGYGEGAPRGKGPNQMRIQSEGNAYLDEEFKDLDSVKSAKIVP